MGKTSGVGRANQGFYGFEVNDSSLSEHGIHPGDTVIVEFTADIVDGELYIIRLGDEILSRRLYTLGDKLRLVSAAGDTQELETQTIEVLGRIMP